MVGLAKKLNFSVIDEEILAQSLVQIKFQNDKKNADGIHENCLRNSDGNK